MPRRFVEMQKGPIGPLRQANRRADYAPAPGNFDSSIAFLDSLASIPALPLDQRWSSVSSKATCSTSSAASSLYKSCSAEPSGTALARLLKKSTARDRVELGCGIVGGSQALIVLAWLIGSRCGDDREPTLCKRLIKWVERHP